MTHSLTILAISAAVLFGTLFGATAAKQQNETPARHQLDFTKKELPAGWRVTNIGWRVEDGELRGEGGGALECTAPTAQNFTLAFDAWTEEKANVEIKLFGMDGSK